MLLDLEEALDKRLEPGDEAALQRGAGRTLEGRQGLSGPGDQPFEGPVLQAEGMERMAGRCPRRFLTGQTVLEDMDMNVAEPSDLGFGQALLDELLFHGPYLGPRNVLDELGEPLPEALRIGALVKVADDRLEGFLAGLAVRAYRVLVVCLHGLHLAGYNGPP